MTLLEFLETLDARPLDASSPKLLVREDDLGEWDADTILDSYERSPYAIVSGLSRVPQLRLHDGGTLTTGAIDVTLLQPTTSTGELPDPIYMARLAALIVRAPNDVTEISAGYKLATPLQVITESDPVPAEPGDPLRGRIAVVRFQYTLWR